MQVDRGLWWQGLTAESARFGESAGAMGSMSTAAPWAALRALLYGSEWPKQFQNLPERFCYMSVPMGQVFETIAG
jgi:hypothetical protein